jgi:hypothetical protein
MAAYDHILDLYPSLCFLLKPLLSRYWLYVSEKPGQNEMSAFASIIAHFLFFTICPFECRHYLEIQILARVVGGQYPRSDVCEVEMRNEMEVENYILGHDYHEGLRDWFLLPDLEDALISSLGLDFPGVVLTLITGYTLSEDDPAEYSASCTAIRAELMRVCVDAQSDGFRNNEHLLPVAPLYFLEADTGHSRTMPYPYFALRTNESANREMVSYALDPVRSYSFTPFTPEQNSLFMRFFEESVQVDIENNGFHTFAYGRALGLLYHGSDQDVEVISAEDRRYADEEYIEPQIVLLKSYRARRALEKDFPEQALTYGENRLLDQVLRDYC